MAITTHNGDPTYTHTGDHHLEFFSKAGSLIKKNGKRGKGSSHYGAGSETTALALFQPCWLAGGIEGKAIAMKLLFWLRDPRAGSGSRAASRDILRWLVKQPDNGSGSGADWLAVNLHRIPEWGRWDDLAELWGTVLEPLAAAIWVEAIMREDHLASKWAKCDMVPLQRALKVNEAGLRKLLRPGREGIVERAMCAKNWSGIDYNKIPSQAAKLYVKAFLKHDKVRYTGYKQALAKGDVKGVKINASTLWPHDVYMQAMGGDCDIAEGQFRALPDWVGPTGRRIMALVDTSGSMKDKAIGSTSKRDIAMALGLYVSDRIGKTNPFYRRYLQFASTPTWCDWRGMSFVQAACDMTGNCDSTNVQAALDSVLQCAISLKVPKDQMITHLLIISDMQFDRATYDSSKVVGMYSGHACVGTEKTVVEKAMKLWEAHGYERPTIIFWNLSGYAGTPARLDTPNTALVSGFSASILEGVLTGKVVSPLETMLKKLERYQIEVPVVGE